MSKKSGKGKKSKKQEEIEELENLVEEVSTEDTSNSAVDIGYLTGAILDYYDATGRQPLDDGDEWKEGTQYEPKAKSNIPKELDDAIREAFLVQIKKFQK
jgi:hypothetical protein